MYSVGQTLRISLFGRSHAERVGCIMEGIPAGVPVDMKDVQRDMDLRRPSAGIGTARREADVPTISGGITDGATDGRPILITIENGDCDSSAYSGFNDRPRPGHADLPAHFRFSDFDVSGGAQFSGRMTAPLVAAGAIARSFLRKNGVQVAAYTSSVYDEHDPDEHTFEEISRSSDHPTRAVTEEIDCRFSRIIQEAASEGDSVGGTIVCMVSGLPIGTGGMWFDALDVSMARMMFSIPGVKGVSFGKGFGIADMKGSDSNDQYRYTDRITSDTNNMGGVVGGMSDGLPLVVNVADKPTPSIGKEQRTVSLSEKRDCSITVGGRHDPCIVPRAVAAVEAMAAICAADQLLSFRLVSQERTGSS